MKYENHLIAKDEEFTRDGYLVKRAEFLAQERAKDLAWAAFQIDRGQPAVNWHWKNCTCGLMRAVRREGESWYVIIMRSAAPMRTEDIAAEVRVDDRTGRCDVKFNPDFVWTDAEASNAVTPSDGKG